MRLAWVYRESPPRLGTCRISVHGSHGPVPAWRSEVEAASTVPAPPCEEVPYVREK